MKHEIATILTTWNKPKSYPKYHVSETGEVYSLRVNRLLKADTYGYYTVVSTNGIKKKLKSKGLILLAYPPALKLVQRLSAGKHIQKHEQ